MSPSVSQTTHRRIIGSSKNKKYKRMWKEASSNLNEGSVDAHKTGPTIGSKSPRVMYVCPYFSVVPLQKQPLPRAPLPYRDTQQKSKLIHKFESISQLEQVRNTLIHLFPHVIYMLNPQKSSLLIALVVSRHVYCVYIYDPSSFIFKNPSKSLAIN